MSRSPEAQARREAVLLSAAVLTALLVLKHAAAATRGIQLVGVPVDDALRTAGFGFMLYVPVLWVGRSGVSFDSLGLHGRHLRGELGVLGVAALATTVLYGGGFAVWVAGRGQGLELRWPSDLLASIPTEVLVVGLSEELFFRGLLQERLARGWHGGPRLFGASVVAVGVAAAVFALAHFVGEYRVSRLSTFFPGLVFGWLRARRGALLAAVGYHGFCNLLQDVLFASIDRG